QLYAGVGLHAAAHLLAEVLQVGGGRRAGVDEEVAVLVRHHGAAEREPAAAGGVDELPGLVARRVPEGAAAGAAADWLAVGALALDLLHARLDRGGVARRAGEPRAQTDPVLRQSRV